jgi:hypothetical protein
MQDGFDLPSRLSSRTGASNPSDARQKKQRVPLHRRQRRKEACRRDPRTSHGREEAGVEGGDGEEATRLSARQTPEQHTGPRTAQKKGKQPCCCSPLAAPRHHGRPASKRGTEQGKPEAEEAQKFAIAKTSHQGQSKDDKKLAAEA